MLQQARLCKFRKCTLRNGKRLEQGKAFSQNL